jgi:hypothetical protein
MHGGGRVAVIRIFIGCAPNHEDAESQSVLEWSIRKHASEPVEIEWMKLSNDPASFWHGWNTESWATPFSGFRWAIPVRCNFEGQAIYMDSDVIVMADIAELWRQEFQPGRVAMAKGGGSWRYCVSKWNCAAMSDCVWPVEHLKSVASAHKSMVTYFSAHPQLTQAFEGDWNCLDGEGHSNLKDGVVKAIHYTDIGTQPQLKYALPRLAAQGRKHWFDGQVRPHPRADLVALFDELLEEATVNGYGVEHYLQEPMFGEIRKAHLTNYKGRAA